MYSIMHIFIPILLGRNVRSVVEICPPQSPAQASTLNSFFAAMHFGGLSGKLSAFGEVGRKVGLVEDGGDVNQTW